ncbi:MAG: hypothetical protein ACLPY5_10190 [Candidatus Bathyarchaeia archaeon]
MKANRICVSTTLCVLLLFCLVQLQANAPTLVSASLCQITNVAYDYPQQVQPNQQILLTSTINASCSYTDPGIYYLAMVVVNDASSGQQISTNSAPIGYVSLQQPNVTATISNLITCPGGNVAWQLRLTVYVINDYNLYFSPVQDTALIHYLTVNVGTLQQQQTVATTTTTTTSPTITSSTTTQMTTNATTIAPATSLETNNQSSITSQSLTILGLTVLIVLLILFWKQRTMSKQNSDPDKTDTTKQKKEKRNSDDEDP